MFRKGLAIFFIIILTFLGLVYLSILTTDKSSATCSVLDFNNIDEVNFRDHDSVLVRASNLYKGNIIKDVIQGKNYRYTWSTPVKVPIVYLDTFHGGLSFIKVGGGTQTQSLKFKDTLGIEYALRSINKDPSVHVPKIAKTLGLENIIIDGISAQHPYIAPVLAKLSDAIHVLHTQPKVVFVPKQDALGNHNIEFGNRLYLLEYESDSDVNWTPFENAETIVDTEDLVEMKMEGSKVSIDKSLLIRSRLFDLMIADWDRHGGQWGWVIQKSDSIKLKAIPLPCDRDNSVFNPEGLVPSIISNRHIYPELRPFENEIDYLPGLISTFDRYFLYQTPLESFQNEAKYIQNHLTDKSIEEAFSIWPKAIYDLDAEEMIKNIKSRRDNIVAYAEDLKKNIDKGGPLDKNLKGLEDLKLSENLIKCFDCDKKNR